MSTKLWTSRSVVVATRESPENTSVETAESSFRADVESDAEVVASSSNSDVTTSIFVPEDTLTESSARIAISSDEIVAPAPVRRSNPPSPRTLMSLAFRVKASTIETSTSLPTAAVTSPMEAVIVASTCRSISWLRLVVVPPVAMFNDVALEMRVASPTSSVASPPIRIVAS